MTTIAGIWDELRIASTSRSPFNFLQLASIGLDGSPQLRTIVVRQCDPAARTVSFATDARSPKIQEIRRDPRVTLVGFDVKKLVQLRFSGLADVIEAEDERRAMWDAMNSRTLLLFDTPYPPGTPIEDDGDALRSTVEEDDLVEPFKKFALVAIRVAQMEWLDLTAEPHGRYSFVHDEERWQRSRLAPYSELRRLERVHPASATKSVAMT